MDVRVGLWRRLSTEELMLLNCSVEEDSWESLGLQGDPTSQSYRNSILNIHWKDWCWSSDTLATWCKEPTHWKRPWCWERLKAGGEGDNRGWDGWKASPTQGTGVWASSRRWWRTGKPGVRQSMGSQRVGRDWASEQQIQQKYSMHICILLHRVLKNVHEGKDLINPFLNFFYCFIKDIKWKSKFSFCFLRICVGGKKTIITS